MKNYERIIFHVDMDAFFASVEQRENPKIRGKPVIVGALPGNRGVVSTASYEARKYGIHSAMPIKQASIKCPEGVFLRPRMNLYISISNQIMTILQSFSPIIEQVSIDEAFLDMTGTKKLWGKPEKAANKILDKIYNKLQLTASIGIAPNKFLAKLGSDMRKPGGITVVPFNRNEVINWLAPIEISKIWGVGKKTEHFLRKIGLQKISDLQKMTQKELKKICGIHGIKLYNLCRGIDTRLVEPYEKSKSISRETTFNQDSYDIKQWHRTILALSRDVAKRVRKNHQKGYTIQLTYRTPDFKRFTRQITLESPTNLAEVISCHAFKLLDKEKSTLNGLRLLGVGITNFHEAVQLDLFDSNEESILWEASEKAMDIISERFGKNAIFRGGELLK
mgnify:CR=1 FL=1